MGDLAPSSAADAPSVGVLVPTRLGGWSCAALALDGDDRLRARFQAMGGQDWLEVSVLAGSVNGPVFHRLEHCAVRYRGALRPETAERKAEAARLVLSVGASIDALLGAHPGKSLAEVLGRSRRGGRVVFGRAALRDLLAPEITEGAPIAEGFALADVYPTSYLQQAHHDLLELLLDFRREADGRRILIEVRRRDDARPGFAATTHLALSQLSLGAADPPGAEAVRALVAFVLQLHDHEGLEIVFPELTSDLTTPLPAPAAATAEEDPDALDSEEVVELNFAINADCGQQCSFCSAKELSPPEDGGDRTLARVVADLASKRARGVRLARINGYDPLAYSRILEVMRRATELGYEAAHVFSPFTRAADAAFCDAMVAALPKRSRFHVPLYSVDAAAHDRLVGRKGAHALVLQAIDNLCARVGREQVWIFMVATRDALADLVEVAAWCAERRLTFFGRMPYPSSESPADRFFQVSPRMAEVATAVVEARGRGVRMRVQGVLPCVLFGPMQRAGVRVRDWLDVGTAPVAPGTEYREPRCCHRAVEAEHAAFHAAVVPCPHLAHCMLASACPGEVMRGYAEAFGIGELEPVSLRALIDAP